MNGYIAGITQEYRIKKRFLTSFREILDLRGAIYLINNNNPSTIVDWGDGTNSDIFELNYYHMGQIKKNYEEDIEDEDFPEAFKHDARTQLAIIDNIEQKFRNAGYEPSPEVSNASSEGGRIKRRSNKRKKTKRRSNKRKKTKRRSNKRKH
jgi:hypothetical protein